MALPMATNVTLDIFHNGGGPTGTPDVSGVAGYLTPVGNITTLNNSLYTNVLLLDTSVDVRDQFGGAVGSTDNVYIPDKNGTKFAVYLVQRVGQGTRTDHKRCFLMRKLPTWPTNNL